MPDMTHQTSSPSETPQRPWNRRQTLAALGAVSVLPATVAVRPAAAQGVNTAWADIFARRTRPDRLLQRLGRQ
jgi:putative thiamine transport system substrate-binding protein